MVPTGAEIVRRPEHPPQQETDDWKAAGMEADSPPRIDGGLLPCWIKGGAVFFCDVDSLSVHQRSGTPPMGGIAQ